MQHLVSFYLISNAKMLMMLMLTRVLGPGHDTGGEVVRGKILKVKLKSITNGDEGQYRM
jgi:hypothetical protein